MLSECHNQHYHDGTPPGKGNDEDPKKHGEGNPREQSELWPSGEAGKRQTAVAISGLGQKKYIAGLWSDQSSRIDAAGCCFFVFFLILF